MQLTGAKTAEYPQVFKLTGGAGSTGVVLVSDSQEAIGLIRRMFGRGIYPENIAHPDSLQRRHTSLLKRLRRKAGDFRRRVRGIDPSPWWTVQKNYVLFQSFMPGNRFGHTGQRYRRPGVRVPQDGAHRRLAGHRAAEKSTMIPALWTNAA